MELPQLIFHLGINIFAALLEQKANSSPDKKARVGAVLSVSSCSLLLSTHTPAQTEIMYHEPFGVSLFCSVKWNVLLLLLLLFVFSGIPEHSHCKGTGP